MFRTLAGRALVPVGLAVTGFVVVCFLLLYTAIKNVVRNDAVAHATNLADIILKSAHDAMLKSERQTLTTIINNIGEQKGVEHIRIFNKKGVVNFSNHPEELNRQVDKKEQGCINCHAGATPSLTLGKMDQSRTFKNRAGTEVLAITAPIYNEPQCSNAACHVHPPTQKVLGTLDIGLSQDLMLATLSSIRTEMIIFTLMILVLTVGGVTALLRRSVFMPVQKLNEMAVQADHEDDVCPPPGHFPLELDRIAKSYYNLCQRLRKSKQELDSIRNGANRPQ